MAFPGPVSPAVCTGCMAAYSQAVFWSQQSDSPEVVGVVDSSPGGRTEERARQVWFLPILVQSSKITLAGLVPSYMLLIYNPRQAVLDPML